MEKRDKLDLMGRRRFMNTLAGLGVSTTVLPYVSQKAAAELQDDSEIVRVYGVINDDSVAGVDADIEFAAEALPDDKIIDPGPDDRSAIKGRMGRRKAILDTISYEKWKTAEAIRDARQRLEQTIPTRWTANREYITPSVEIRVEKPVSSQTDPGSRYLAPIYPIYKKKGGKGNDVNPTVSFDEFRDEFPATISGIAGRGTYLETMVEEIPVRPTKKEINLHAYYDNYYRPVPAGCVFGTGADNSATLGVRAYDFNDGSNVILTAAHTFKEWPIGWSTEAHQPVWISGSDEFKIGETDPNRRAVFR